MSAPSANALFSPKRTPYNRGLLPFWMETTDGFLLQPRVGKLSLYAFIGSFLLFVVCFGLFLEILAFLNQDLREYKFRMYLTFILFAPVFSTVVAFFFRRLLRGLWGEIRFFQKSQTLRISRKGSATSLPLSLITEVEVQMTEYTNGENQWQILFRLDPADSPQNPVIYFWGFPEERAARNLAERLDQRIREESKKT